MTAKPIDWMKNVWDEQQTKNNQILADSRYLGEEIRSEVLPFQIVISEQSQLSESQGLILEALQIEAAKIAIKSLASLAKINELDHLGGGLDLISAFMLTLAVTDYEQIEYTIEHAHTSIGYYSSLAALGFLQPADVITSFRRGIEIAGHVSWVPGGTQLNGGRLGVMVPVAVGFALGKRALISEGTWVITHCGDAGWISGQALNGFNGAALHSAPVTFVMHRNGIQLSGATNRIMPKDPRPIVESLGITILEIPSLHDTNILYSTYREAYSLAQDGIPSLIYPTGIQSDGNRNVDLNEFGRMYGIQKDTEKFAKRHSVTMDTKIWIPGSLMSFRDVEAMLECLFLVNDLPGGEGHHDGHMKGRNLEQVLNSPLMRPSAGQKEEFAALQRKPKRVVISRARPAKGSKNLELPADVVSRIKLPEIGSKVSARAGAEAGYAAIASTYPDNVFVVSCDLDVSTKLAKARQFLKSEHQFEMSIEEQAAALMASGLAFNTRSPQLNVFSTFAAFFEGIAREGFELWRYQRNLNGINEGLNVTLHLSHVGACTGRDHFSGWGLDWVTLAIGYLPYIRRFYAPADARAAFLAVRDIAAHYGGHILAIPRDLLPILARQDGSGPLWEVDAEWEVLTSYRTYPDAKKAILCFGAPSFLADDASDDLHCRGKAADVYVVNGLPLSSDILLSLFTRYVDGIVTVEDGIIATRSSGLRGFASVISSAAYPHEIPLNHVGITDPRIAPSEGHMETWAHFGITTEAIVKAVENL